MKMMEGSRSSSKSRLLKHMTVQSVVSGRQALTSMIGGSKQLVIDLDSPRTKQACLNLGVTKAECMKK